MDVEWVHWPSFIGSRWIVLLLPKRGERRKKERGEEGRGGDFDQT
jgi:hypothetical protein